MSKPFCYYWPPSEVAGVSDALGTYDNLDAEDGNCLGLEGSFVCNVPRQPGAFAYANIINPNLTTPGITTNIIRSIQISSADDLHDTVFTISGIGSPVDANGNPTQIVAPISEQIMGVNANSVPSANIYTVIDSITVDRLTGMFSVGYGPNGITNYYLNDLNRNVIQGYANSFSQQMKDNNTAETVAVYVSLNYPESSNGIPDNGGGLFPFGIVNDANIAFMPAYEYQAPITHSQGPSLNTFTNYLYTGVAVVWANIALTTTDHLFFTIFQQGI